LWARLKTESTPPTITCVKLHNMPSASQLVDRETELVLLHLVGCVVLTFIRLSC